MSRKVYHVAKERGGPWKGTVEGARRASVTAETKAEAVARTAQLARSAPLGQVVIHKENGVIQSERTYGKDPTKYPG